MRRSLDEAPAADRGVERWVQRDAVEAVERRRRRSRRDGLGAAVEHERREIGERSALDERAPEHVCAATFERAVVEAVTEATAAQSGQLGLCVGDVAVLIGRRLRPIGAARSPIRRANRRGVPKRSPSAADVAITRTCRAPPVLCQEVRPLRSIFLTQTYEVRCGCGSRRRRSGCSPWSRATSTGSSAFTRERGLKRATALATPSPSSCLGGVGVTRVDRPGVDREVHHQLRAERLDELHLALDAAVGRDAAGDRRVLEVLGADADDHTLAGVVA